MKADARTSVEIEKTLDKITRAYRERDIESLMECFAPDDDASLIGTSADEKRVGLEQIRIQAERDWASTESAEIALTKTRMSCVGPAAWVFAEGAFNLRANGQSVHMPARMSFVLENRGNRWLIQHAHFSSPGA